MREVTALARAQQTRDTFPKGPITIAQARAMFVAMADSQVGYTSGDSEWSMYGKPQNWPIDWAGRQVYWCLLGASWVAAQTFGVAAARAGFGRQYDSWAYPPVGGTWTVWALSWGRARGAVVPFDSQQLGDLLLTYWRRVPGAEVDHVDIVRGPRTLNLSNVIGFNTSSSSTSAGAGVFRAARPESRVVAVVRPDWAALVAAYNATVAAEEVIDWTQIHIMLLALGYSADVQGVRAYQHDRGLTVDGIPGKNTTAALEEDMATLEDIRTQNANMAQRIEQIYQRQGNADTAHNNIMREVKATLAEVRALPGKVWDFRTFFRPGTMAHNTFGDSWPVRGLLAYAAVIGARGTVQKEADRVIAELAEDDAIGGGQPHVDGPATAAVEEQS